MSNPIGWTDQTWNPITGCTKVSEGCWNCYAERMAKRLAGRFGYPAAEPFTVSLHRDKLDAPLRWRTPRYVFPCSMGDMFHGGVSLSWLDAVWSVMAVCGKDWARLHPSNEDGELTGNEPLQPKHIFQVLTKRPKAMREYLDGEDLESRWVQAIYESVGWWGLMDVIHFQHQWPLPNVWLGVTAENQARADERIPVLLDTPAAVRFVSVEPMLGPVDVEEWLDLTQDDQSDLWHRAENEPVTVEDARRLWPKLDWVICGPETGPGARPFDPQWARDLREQCSAAGVPFWFKGGLLDGREWKERP